MAEEAGMTARTLTRTTLMVLLAASPALLPSCGYSEEEWQAQLAKYQKLNDKNSDLERQLAEAQQKVKELTAQLESMGVKLNEGGNRMAELEKALAEYKARAEMLERVKARFELLRKKLQKMTELGLNVSIRRNRMVISLPGDVVFDPGEDTLSDKGAEILGKVAEVIASDESLSKRMFQVAGHTDNEPLRRTGAKFKDNWGLSVMRARQVVVYLVTPKDDKKGGGGLVPTNWSAAGYGDTDPLVGNDTADNRRKNRRVELVLLPDVEEMLDLQSLAAAE
jgi:chemotaxis protein MotB